MILIEYRHKAQHGNQSSLREHQTYRTSVASVQSTRPATIVTPGTVRVKPTGQW